MSGCGTSRAGTRWWGVAAIRPAGGGDLDEVTVVATLVDVDDRAGLGVLATLAASDTTSPIRDVLDPHWRRSASTTMRSGRQTLIGVADDADVLVAAGEHEDHLVLGLVRVLVLVDQDVLEPLAVVLEHVAVLAEQHDGLHQQVVEVHRPGLLEAELVLGVDVGVLAVEDVGRPVGAPRQGRRVRSSSC